MRLATKALCKIYKEFLSLSEVISLSPMQFKYVSGKLEIPRPLSIPGLIGVARCDGVA